MFSSLSRIKAGYTLLLLQVALATFSLAFVPLYFREQGFPLWSLVLLYASYSGLGVLAIPLVSKYSFRRFVTLSFFLYALLLLLLGFLPAQQSALFFPLIMALNLVFYWIPLNYIFFQHSVGGTNALDGAFYMTASGFLAMLLPPVSSLVLEHAGYPALFLLTASLYAIPLIIALRKVPVHRLEVGFALSLRQFKRLKTITILEGALQFFGGVILPVFSLLFIKTATGFAGLLSFLGLISLVITLLVSWKSDRQQQRLSYIFLLFALMSIALLLMPFVSSLTWWLLIIGLYSGLAMVSAPIRLALSMDVKQVDLNFWVAREWLLNLGRFVTLGISTYLFYVQEYWAVFGMYAVIAVAYPFVAWWKVGRTRRSHHRDSAELYHTI